MTRSAEEVHLQHPVEIGRIEVDDRARDQDARVVHHQVDAPGAVPGALHRAGHRGPVGHVRGLDLRDPASSTDLAGDLVELVLASRDEHGPRADPAERERRRPPDPARRAGDQHRLAAEVVEPRHAALLEGPGHPPAPARGDTIVIARACSTLGPQETRCNATRRREDPFALTATVETA